MSGTSTAGDDSRSATADRSLRTRVGRVLVVASVGLLFFAYLNFAPTALSSDYVADYVKNHFVREVIFGVCLAAWTIRLALQPLDPSRLRWIALLGSVVVLPFWVAWLAGWSTGGIEEVWGDSIGPGSAYLLHGSQALSFYIGLALLWPPASAHHVRRGDS